MGSIKYLNSDSQKSIIFYGKDKITYSPNEKKWVMKTSAAVLDEFALKDHPYLRAERIPQNSKFERGRPFQYRLYLGKSVNNQIQEIEITSPPKIWWFSKALRFEESQVIANFLDLPLKS